MLNGTIRILNFDDSLTGQKRILSRYNTEILDLKDLAPRSRVWMNRSTRARIRERIQKTKKDAVTFIGSGDFHHVSEILINEFSQDLCLIMFDFHPDWYRLPPRFGCGSWLNEVLKNNNIRKCVLMGTSSCDISTWPLQWGNLECFKDDRVEIYPYAHRPSLVFLRRVPQNISLRVERRFLYDRIFWKDLKDTDLKDFTLSLIKRLPTREVYVSIDKDCLKKEYALTNWEEGLLSLEDLLLMLRIIRENLEIVGADICGDYSDVHISGAFKNFISGLDRPKNIPAKNYSAEDITSINESTNLKILQTLFG